MAQIVPDDQVVKAYWQPGCTSCLRMKEFLAKHGVPFVSVNVLEDPHAYLRSVMSFRKFSVAGFPCQLIRTVFSSTHLTLPSRWIIRKG